MRAAAARTASQLSVFESGLDEETILVAMRELQRGAADGAPHREGPDKHGDVEDGPPPEEEPGCVYLEGSRRKVDFILVYSPAKNQAVRDIFEEELLKAGLLLDYVPQVGGSVLEWNASVSGMHLPLVGRTSCAANTSMSLKQP